MSVGEIICISLRFKGGITYVFHGGKCDFLLDDIRLHYLHIWKRPLSSDK